MHGVASSQTISQLDSQRAFTRASYRNIKSYSISIHHHYHHRRRRRHHHRHRQRRHHHHHHERGVFETAVSIKQ